MANNSFCKDKRWNKVCYETALEAKSIIERLKQRDKKRNEKSFRRVVYHCSSCGFYHIGHVAQWERQQRNIRLQSKEDVFEKGSFE